MAVPPLAFGLAGRHPGPTTGCTAHSATRLGSLAGFKRRGSARMATRSGCRSPHRVLVRTVAGVPQFAADLTRRFGCSAGGLSFLYRAPQQLRAQNAFVRPNRLHTHTHPPKRLAHPRSPIPPLSTLTSRATHAHPTSPRSTGFCAIWGCISSSSSIMITHSQVTPL